MGESLEIREGSFQNYLEERMELPQRDLREYSPLVLAYIGDAVFELVLRTVIVQQNCCQVQKLHRRTSTLVKAEAQSEMIGKLEPHLTEEEQAVYRRGRNAKSYTKAKNASVLDYRRATGLEALIGWLYLKKDWKRIVDLIQFGLEDVDLKRVDAHNHHEKK